MPALDGAIERVRIEADGTVADPGHRRQPRPRASAAPAWSDLLAELRRTGRMNAQGRLSDDQPFPVDAATASSLSARPTSTSSRRPRAPTPPACASWLDAYGVPLERVEPLYPGRRLRRATSISTAARRIGLIPDLPARTIVQVGNAALAGASMALLSRTARAAARGSRQARRARATREPTRGSSTSSSRAASSNRSVPECRRDAHIG